MKSINWYIFKIKNQKVRFLQFLYCLRINTNIDYGEWRVPVRIIKTFHLHNDRKRARNSSSPRQIDDPLVRPRIRSACTGCNCAKVTIGFLFSGGMPRRRRILSAPTGVSLTRIGQLERRQRHDLYRVSHHCVPDVCFQPNSGKQLFG